MSYLFNESHKEWMIEQVWESVDDLSIYGKLSDFEYEQYNQYLPMNPRNIMDIGCGLGRVSIKVNRHYRKARWEAGEFDYSMGLAEKPYFILADRNGRTENYGIMFPEHKDEYYNNFDEMISFCKLNGLENVSRFDTERDDWNDLPTLDLVISCCAYGFHFKLGRYIDRLCKVASKDVTMIFGVNIHTRSPVFEDIFKESLWVEGKEDSRFPFQNWIILKGLK